MLIKKVIYNLVKIKTIAKKKLNSGGFSYLIYHSHLWRSIS